MDGIDWSDPEAVVRAAHEKAQCRHHYAAPDKGGSTYRVFDGRTYRARPLGAWMKSRKWAWNSAADDPAVQAFIAANRPEEGKA